MFVPEFNINFQVAVSIQLYKELREQYRFISWNLIKSQMLHDKHQSYV